MTLITRLSFFCFTLGICLASCNKPSAQDLDISSLCKKLTEVSSIIGLGESTHGTKEFTKYRAEIVRELVEKYDYRVFILEAEYSKCANINRYILTGEGDPKVLLNKINLWPWNNQGFLELISWMREFNLSHSTDPLRFFGMDSQEYRSYLQCVEFNLPSDYFDKYNSTSRDSILKHYPIRGQLIFDIEDAANSPFKTINELRNLAKQWESTQDDIDLSLQYHVFTRIHSQSMREPKNLNIRDQNMAELVELILSKFQKKAIIWAHNGHVFRGNDIDANIVSTGYHLSKLYGKEYAVVGFDFKGGTFNAIPNDKRPKEMTIYEYKQIIETLSSKIDFGDQDYKIIDCSEINGDFYTNSIGATYRENPQKVERYAERVHNNTEFDYMFNIPLSTPTKLLSN